MLRLPDIDTERDTAVTGASVPFFFSSNTTACSKKKTNQAQNAVGASEKREFGMLRVGRWGERRTEEARGRCSDKAHGSDSTPRCKKKKQRRGT